MMDSKAILKKYAARIADVQAESSKEMSPQQKRQEILGLLQEALAALGKLYLVGGLPVHVDEAGTISRLMPGTDLNRFLSDLGFIPGDDNYDVLLSLALQCRRDIPANFVHSIAHFDTDTFTLNVNEWGGTYLRCGSDGIWTRHKVGEFDVLFDTGEEPHPPLDLHKINTYHGPALAWTEDSPLVKYIFGIGKFAGTSGIGRLNCITTMLLFLIAIVYRERVLVLPILRLCGLTGSRKTATCVAIGWLLSGLGMRFAPTACPENKADLENCLINSKGFLLLDEVNALKPLNNLLKSVGTGGELKRRVLYTTDAQRSYPIDVALGMSANTDSAVDEALIARCVKIDLGDPASDNAGWRGDYGVRQEWKTMNIRQQCWEDLVCRCAAAMRLLHSAMVKGEADPRVQHRMSGFWSFCVSLSHQESPEAERMIADAMAASSQENRLSANSIDDILPRLQKWLEDTPKALDARWSASEIGVALLRQEEARLTNTMSPQVRAILQSAYMLSNRLRGSSEYRRLLGLEIHRGHQRNLFSFRLPAKKEEI
jgi:hypothetical protein